jgi:hypothetical protein
MLRSIHETLADFVSAAIGILAGTFAFSVILGVFGLGSAILGGIVAVIFAVAVSARCNPQGGMQ